MHKNAAIPKHQNAFRFISLSSSFFLVLVSTLRKHTPTMQQMELENARIFQTAQPGARWNGLISGNLSSVAGDRAMQNSVARLQGLAMQRDAGSGNSRAWPSPQGKRLEDANKSCGFLLYFSLLLFSSWKIKCAKDFFIGTFKSGFLHNQIARFCAFKLEPNSRVML